MHGTDATAAAAAAAAAAAIIDPASYSAYHHPHPYYRVAASTSGVKDFSHPVASHHPHHSHHPHQHPHHQAYHHHPSLIDHHPSPVSSPSASSQSAAAQAVQTRLQEAFKHPILEMRKEKSRDAARSRRGKENHEFYELAKMLPLPAAITSQLDKASIIRLTISYLKLREFSQSGIPSWRSTLSSMSALKCKANNLFESHQGTHILQSLDGFAFALGQDGRFLYISETVSIYLGLSQVEMTGSSIFDYTHQQDQAELAEQLGLNQISASSGSSHHHSASPMPPGSVSSSASNESDSGNHYSSGNHHITINGANDTMERQFCIRMKSTLTKRGCQHFKSSGYRVVSIVAHFRSEMLRRQNSGPLNGKIIGLVAIAIALPPPSINELRLEPDMFVTRHSLDLKIIHCEQRISDLLSYSPDEVVGRSLYSLIHGQDVNLLKKSHLDLVQKGQSMSGYYRVINKSGGYTWMQTCATLICNSSSSSASTQSKATTAAAAAAATAVNNGSAGNAASASNSSSPSNASMVSAHDDQDQSIICVNYVLSAIEYTGVIMDSCQLETSKITISNSTVNQSMSPVKTRPIQIKKSHSSTPSPEIIASKLNAGLVMRPNSNNADICLPPNEQDQQQHLSQPSPQSHIANLSRSRLVHSESAIEHRTESKRRRLNSSPVRPWKSPSPQNPISSVAAPPTEANATTSPNLLRHISVIRETPPILKPQVMAPSPYHPHHYHHLVDQYAAAYHLYKTGPNGTPIGSQTNSNGPSHGAHYWGAYG